MSLHPSRLTALVVELDALLAHTRNVQLDTSRGDHLRSVIDSAIDDLGSARCRLADLEEFLHRQQRDLAAPAAADDPSTATTREHRRR